MKTPPLMILTLVSVLFPCTVRAQGLTTRMIPPLVASGELKPGTWVQYQMLMRKSRTIVKVKLSALAVEDEGQWFEIALTDPMRRTLIFRTLVQGKLSKPKAIKKVIVQPPGQRPLELPPTMLKNPLPTFRSGRAVAGKGAKGKRETVKVAAGSFKAVRYRTENDGQVSEAWISKTIKGWPLVKVSTPLVLMELAGHGEKGKSDVKGKPVKMDEKLVKRLGIKVP